MGSCFNKSQLHSTAKKDHGNASDDSEGTGSSVKAKSALSVPSYNLRDGISNSRSRSYVTSLRGRSKTTDVHVLTLQCIDVSKINNGVTGTLINALVVQIAADFWNKLIANKPMADKLEISCAIFFDMMTQNSETHGILKRTFTTQHSIQKSSLRLFDMLHWLLQSLLRSDVDLVTVLRHLGNQHHNMGIDMHHLSAMLTAIHTTFSYYFPIQYGVQVKYAFDQIFSVAARVMTGQTLTDVSNEFHGVANLSDDDESQIFLQSLSACLKCNIGRTYLFRFLQQKFCDEVVIFLQSMKKFRQQTSDKERFMVAREVVKNTIATDALFCVNISHELRESILANMQELERTFSGKKDLQVAKDFFVDVEKEMNQLVMENHWYAFAATFKCINDACE
eukprot:CAMPEP_0202708148 /NCGR_PEP_ID=MMETSP1385-20130828/20396_1 /ASSEMBLY_ACC=CAM_ASM_000861 /TAXON_ID=933848 /ORGANISM="Elphidium margaritaceum" /LENGTH=392 /DNA_ID=CAMNT_0049367049 /DNA_START=64 /DNA_END=1242 /DNA_ORIENTATION=+